MSTSGATHTTIIIVEDQELSRMGIRTTLHRLPGIAVIGEASNGQEAIELVASLSPDLVLMDLAMPIKDGIDATREIKQAWPDTRVIVLTAHDSDRYVFAALGAGADGYCMKSTRSTQLAAAIESVMEGAAWLDATIARRVLRAAANVRSLTEIATRKHTDYQLSQREMEVLELLAEGLTNQQIAFRLVVTSETIKSHMKRIMAKLLVSDRTQAAVKAMKEGLIRSLSQPMYLIDDYS
jgi:DNA-binding NarL/FixJ family response regulator